MSFSDQLEIDILDEVFGGTAYTAVATIWIGLSTADPGEAAAGLAEPSGNGYARVAIQNNIGNWRAAVTGTKQNSAPLTFPEASGSWGLCTHFTLFNHVTSTGAAVFMGSAALGTSKTPTSGDTPRFQTDSLQITLT